MILQVKIEEKSGIWLNLYMYLHKNNLFHLMEKNDGIYFVSSRNMKKEENLEIIKENLCDSDYSNLTPPIFDWPKPYTL